MMAVVTPAFRLPRGIYYVEVSYKEQGIAKAALVYEITDKAKGREIVGDDEFALNAENDDFSYRVKIEDDSSMRFMLRLTGDAADGDYVQLLRVRIVSSQLTYGYRIFCLAFLFLFMDMLIWGYLKYYQKWNPEQKITFLLLVMTAFFIGLPLYRNGLPYGNDLTFHLYRIKGLSQGLSSGQFPVRIQPGWMDGYGYAASIFYGDIFLYIPAFLFLVGFTLQNAYKCYVVIVNIVSVFIAFYAFWKVSRNRTAALTASVLYNGSVYRLCLLYSAVIGGYSAMMFYPLIMAGFYLLFTEDGESKEYKKIWVLLTLGFTGLLMTHMISCLMVGVYAVLCCAVMIWKVFRKHTFMELLKAIGAAVLLNLWFLVPFFQYMSGEKLRINSGLSQVLEIVDYPAAMAGYTKSGKNFYTFLIDTDNVGYALIGGLMLYLVTMPLHKKDRLAKHSRVILGFTVFSLWICSVFFPTVGLAGVHSIFYKYFMTVQYQNRFLSVAVAFLSCLCALLLAMKIGGRLVTYGIAGILCCVMLYQDIGYFEAVDSDIIYNDDTGSLAYSIGHAEYLPVATDMGNMVKEVEKDEAVQITDMRKKYLTYDITAVNTANQEQKILLPVLYYSGYQAYDDRNKEKLETVMGDNGRVMITIPADYSGTFRMTFHEPWYWRVSEIVSFMTLFFMVYYKKKGKEFKIVWKLKKLQTRHSGNMAE